MTFETELREFLESVAGLAVESGGLLMEEGATFIGALVSDTPSKCSHS